MDNKEFEQKIAKLQETWKKKQDKYYPLRSAEDRERDSQEINKRWKRSKYSNMAQQNKPVNL